MTYIDVPFLCWNIFTYLYPLQMDAVTCSDHPCCLPCSFLILLWAFWNGMTASACSTHSRETPRFYNFQRSIDFLAEWKVFRFKKKDENILSNLDGLIPLLRSPACIEPGYLSLQSCSISITDSCGVKHVFALLLPVLLIIFSCITIWSPLSTVTTLLGSSLRHSSKSQGICIPQDLRTHPLSLQWMFLRLC